VLEGIILSFKLFFDSKGHIFAGIDSYSFKIMYASQYYTVVTKVRSKYAKLSIKYAKLSIGADVLAQIVCSVKVRLDPTKHNNADFKPIVTKISEIKKLS